MLFYAFSFVISYLVDPVYNQILYTTLIAVSIQNRSQLFNFMDNAAILPGSLLLSEYCNISTVKVNENMWAR